MSEIQLSTSQSNDSENQFNMGIKMVINAFENNCHFLSSEITRLNNELEEKNKKISELEELCSTLLNQKNSFEKKITNLKNKNEKILSQLDKVNKENYELKKIKQTIINTIESNKIKTMDNRNNHSLLNGGNTIDNINYLSNENLNNKSTLNIYKNIKTSKCAFGNLLNLKKKNEKQNYLTEKNKSYSVERIQSRTRTNSISEIDSISKILIKQDNEKNNNINTNNNIINNTNNNNQIKNTFFQKCRSKMNPSHYTDLMNIVHLFNSKEITKKEMYDNIIETLKNGKYENLIDDFNNLFT